MLTPTLLNVFVDIYNTCVRNLPTYWKMLIAALSLVFCLYYLYKIVKKSNDKQPINWGYVVLMIVFGALSILYIMP